MRPSADASVNTSVDALVFDFDGTLLDTETPEYVAWGEIYADHGVELPRTAWIDAIGRGHEQEGFDPTPFWKPRQDAR